MRLVLSITRGSKLKAAQPKISSKAKKPAMRRRKLTILAIYLTALVGLIALGSSPSRVFLSKAYTNNQYHFSIKPPKRWKIKEGQKNSIVEFFDPKASFDKITVNGEKVSLSLTQYVALAKSLIPKIYPSYTQLGEFKATVQGQPVRVIDGQAVIDNMWKKTRAMIAVKNGYAYVIGTATTFGDWDSNKLIIDSSLKSFKLQ